MKIFKKKNGKFNLNLNIPGHVTLCRRLNNMYEMRKIT